MTEHTDQTTCLEVLLELSATNHGWFRSREAEERGVSPATLSRLRSIGSIETPKRDRTGSSAIRTRGRDGPPAPRGPPDPTPPSVGGPR